MIINNPDTKKTRKFDGSYHNNGFVETIKNGEVGGQCIFCTVRIGNSALKPTGLERHMKSAHPAYDKKTKEFFNIRAKEYINAGMKPKLKDKRDEKIRIIRASYMVAYILGKQKKPYTDGQNVIKPCICAIINAIIGEEFGELCDLVPL